MILDFDASSEESRLRLQILQKRLGFALAFIGVTLQLLQAIQVDVPIASFLGWAIAFLGVLLCAKTMVGDFGWCLFAFLPGIGAPIAIAGIAIQEKWFGGSHSRRYFVPIELVPIALGMAILFGGCAVFGVNHVWHNSAR